MANFFVFRWGRRTILLLIAIISASVYLLSSLSSYSYDSYTSFTTCHQPRSEPEDTLSGSTNASEVIQYRYINLNHLNASEHAKENGEHLLVLTLVNNNDAQHLEQYFRLLDKTTYPNQLISVGLLVSNANEATMDTVQRVIYKVKNRWFNHFYDVTVYQRDFPIDTTVGDDADLAMVAYQRSIVAKARNYLLTAALKEYHSWVAWIDLHVVQYPTSIFNDLMSTNVDVIVPNCLLLRKDGAFWGFDHNNWAETDASIQMVNDMQDDRILMEGYEVTSVSTGRMKMVDMPTHLGLKYKVRLDSVGGTFTLVKATVHRQGAIFPPFPFRHAIDTEGFGQMANAMGFDVYGIPGYRIYHS
ncbi:Anp1-domain-containing protein [Radiomyces spectabilis]|uniref:Anp1-domain-containing protein n=1 Tax=Radiomyces spectabilis TaxID=64574 RepID=UPI00222023C5|nr:Anp1-domain-containing protein [Radiomyces spectabilis]KAI8393883.1 Anp1-domain-containing protein [Radiomyces spectabilis]